MKTKSLTDRTIQGILLIFSGQMSQSILSIVVMIVLARLLSPKEYGIVGAAMVVVGFSQIFSKLGIAPAIVQRPNLGSLHIKVGFTLSIIFGLVVGLVFVFSAPLIAGFFGIPELNGVIQVLALVFPLSGLGIVGKALLQKEMQFGRLAATELVSYLLGYGLLGIILASNGWGYWALVSAHLGQTVLHTLTLLMMKRDVLGFSLSAKETRELLNFGVGFSLARFFNYLATQADNLVVGRWLGAEALGIYGRAYQCLMMPANMVGNVVDMVLFPAMASVQKDKVRLGRAYTQAVAVVAMVTLPLSGFLVILAPEIIHVLLGGQWMEMVLPFQVLASALVFRTSYKISDSLARATGAVYRRAWRQCFYAVAVFVGAWVGHFWGLAGVAFGVTVAIILNFLFMLQLSARLVFISWRELGEIHFRYTTIAGAIIGSIWVFKVVLGNSNLHPILILAFGVLIALITLVWLWLAWRKIFGEEGEWIVSLAKRHGRAVVLRLGIGDASP